MQSSEAEVVSLFHVQLACDEVNTVDPAVETSFFPPVHVSRLSFASVKHFYRRE